jgi:hypothetical protein
MKLHRKLSHPRLGEGEKDYVLTLFPSPKFGRGVRDEGLNNMQLHIKRV